MNRVPRHVFDLDKPQKERWAPILSIYKDKFEELKPKINALVDNFGLNKIYYYLIDFMIYMMKNKIMYYE